MNQAISPLHPGNVGVNRSESMHPCFYVDEIVRLIACELVTSKGHGTAVALACCCKGFEAPVLDVLWETLELLDPLFKTLPGDVWRDGYNSFKRLPTTPEWARFRKYARRMRNLGLGRCHLEDLSLELLWVLELHAANEPLLPNLETLDLRHVTRQFIPFLPLVLSPRTTDINIAFCETDSSEFPTAIVASIITTLPTLCPDLQEIGLPSLPRDPMITTAVSGMLLASNRNLLRSVYVDSPLTADSREVIFKLPNLRELSVVIERDTSSPSAILPNLTSLIVEYDHDSPCLQMFHRAVLGELKTATFCSESEQIGDFLEAFESLALTTSISTTLLSLTFHTSRPWRPNYGSLLPFTQLEELDIQFSCGRGCSSTIDDNIIADIARAMPQLKLLRLGKEPCKTPTGITAKGLAALSRYCLRLAALSIHFRVASLDPPVIPIVSLGEPTIPREDCALTHLDVGKIPVQEKSTLMVALFLIRIFPHLLHIQHSDKRWKKVAEAICLSKQLAEHSRATLETI